MTMPAHKIQMPQMPAPQQGAKHTRLSKPETSLFLTTGAPYTRVLMALISTKWLTRFEARYLGIADLMVMCELSSASVYAAIKTLTSEGRCHKLEGRYGYVEVTGPRLSTPRPLDGRGRYDREGGKGARKPKEVQPETPAEFHNPVHNYGHGYGKTDAENAVQDSEKHAPERTIEESIYISTTTDTDTRAEGTLAGEDQVAKAEAVVVVVGEASPESELHPPVGGTADAVRAENALPVQENTDADTESQQKTATENENVPPPGAATVAPRTQRDGAAPAGLNSLLLPDWQAAFGTIEGAGLTGAWLRWTGHVGGSASQQLAQAEQWAEWVGAGLAESLRLQVPETIGDPKVENPVRHLVGAMRNRAEQARRAPAAPARVATAQVEPDAMPKPGQRRVDPKTGEIWTVEGVAYGQVTFEEPDAPLARVSQVAAWEVAE